MLHGVYIVSIEKRVTPPYPPKGNKKYVWFYDSTTNTVINYSYLMANRDELTEEEKGDKDNNQEKYFISLSRFEMDPIHVSSYL